MKFKVGDKVKVFKKVVIPGIGWNGDMDNSIGKVALVKFVGARSIALSFSEEFKDLNQWNYPSECLSLFKKPKLRIG